MMKRLSLAVLCLLHLPAALAAAPNVLLICVDDLRPELGCYGVDAIKSPNIDRLASAGRLFRRHYVQAPTCGASRYALLTGTYGPADNGALFKRAAKIAKDPDSVPPSLPEWFRTHSYTTVSIGKVSHHPGGFGGGDWDDKSKLEMPRSWDRSLMPCGPWQHPRGAMHGLANGEIRTNAGKMPVFQTFDGPDTSYPDGLTTDAALSQLDQLSKDRTPFFLAVGIIRPHLPFGAPARYFSPYREADLAPTPHPEKPSAKTTWHGSGEFMKYQRWGKDPRADTGFAVEVRRHYAACVSYADAQVGRLLEHLKKLELADNTIVVLWGDHGWHLGEHSIWGKHSLFEEALHSPLIVTAPGLAKAGLAANGVVEAIDIFPTLCDLAGLPQPDFLDGSTLRPQLDDPAAPGANAISYTSKARTIRTDRHRLIVHKNGHLELYDHASKDKETRNLAADQPELAQRLRGQLETRLTPPPANAETKASLPSKDRFHLFLLAGQSNMAGRGTVTPEDRRIHPRVFALAKDGNWKPAVDPIHYDKKSAGVGLGKSFAIAMAGRDENISIGLVPSACGGSPISTWKPGEFHDQTRSHPYDDAIQRCRRAMRDGTLKGVLWHQGESDSNPGRAEAHEKALRELIERFRADLDSPALPFIIGQLGQFPGRPWTPARKRVDQAQQRIADKIPCAAFVSSDDLTARQDGIHFNAASLRIFGRRYADAYLAALPH